MKNILLIALFGTLLVPLQTKPQIIDFLNRNKFTIISTLANITLLNIMYNRTIYDLQVNSYIDKNLKLILNNQTSNLDLKTNNLKGKIYLYYKTLENKPEPSSHLRLINLDTINANESLYIQIIRDLLKKEFYNIKTRNVYRPVIVQKDGKFILITIMNTWK